MKLVNIKIAVLALACSVVGPASAGELRAANVRNCTWCHGTSAQGYATAPRLAGQRPGYIEKQLVSFANHARDNPLSREYMWNATEALNRRSAHDLAIYFSTLAPRAANDGHRELVARGKTIYELGIGLSRSERRGRQRHSPFGRAGVRLFENQAPAMGRGVSCRRRVSHAESRPHP